jgi:LmbE family N-acetylglucosaminyl deacetylase
MAKNNPYDALITGYLELLGTAADPKTTARRPPVRAPDEPQRTVLLLSPHPDDECLVGGLALRLRRELGCRVVNLAVTLGSRPERRAARWQELEAACALLDFELLAAAEGGLAEITPAGRRARPEDWAAAAGQVARCLYDLGPDMIFMPHEADWNQTHVGVHHLTLKALRRLPADFACLVVETEFWGMMASPNLMVESPARDVADLVQALACHAGEIARNPYHLRLPAWMIDNVRRGSELVLGQGASAPSIAFATLYRLGRWSEGMLRPVIPSSACLGGGADLAQEIP